MKRLPRGVLPVVDDAFYLAEKVVENVSEPTAQKVLRLLGHKFKMRTIRKRDTLRKNLIWLESKTKTTHSPMKRMDAFERSFSNGALDVRKERLKKIVKRFQGRL